MNLPIRARLTAIYCIVFCLGAAVLEIGAFAGLHLAILAIADRDLHVRLAGVEEFLADHLPRLSLARVRREIENHAALQPDLLKIIAPDGDSIFEAKALYSATANPLQPVRKAWTTSESLRILAARRSIAAREYQIWVATDLTLPFEILHRFGLLLLLSAPIVIAASAAVGHWVAGRALAPVMAIATVARTLDATDLSRRLDLPENRDELRYLAETLNGMLARMESSFRKVTEFTANASHELRTPLAVIRATAEVALMRTPPPPPHQPNEERLALQHILTEAERNTALLEDLLRLARADSGTAAMNLKPVDLAESLRSTCQRCDALATQRGLHLRLALSLGSVWVSADAEYLKCLLRILIDNAIKYTPEGGVVQVALKLPSPDTAICEVRDTGIGISAADLPRIFERFYRADRARGREGGGAGLGLAIAEWVASAHRGRVEVESVLGVGSTFRLVLPRLERAATAADQLTEHQLSLQGNKA